MNISAGLVRKMEDFDPKMKDILLSIYLPANDHVHLAARALPAATKRYTAPIWQNGCPKLIFWQNP
jgi:hypothetical protein